MTRSSFVNQLQLARRKGRRKAPVHPGNQPIWEKYLSRYLTGTPRKVPKRPFRQHITRESETSQGTIVNQRAPNVARKHSLSLEKCALTLLSSRNAACGDP